MKQLEATYLDNKKLNTEFCDLVGIPKVYGYIKNLDTNETRIYHSRSSLYRIPKGWTNYKVTKLEPVYPDLTESNNFVKLINIQFELFGVINADRYIRVKDENFQTSYLHNRVQGIKLCKAFGGGDMLDLYIKTVRDTEFNYSLF